MNRKEKRIYKRKAEAIIKEYNKPFDRVYEAAASIAKDWDRKTIPLITLNEIIKISMPDCNTGIKDNDNLLKGIADNLQELNKDLGVISKKMFSKDIPISKILLGINTVKNAFRGGMMKDFE